MHGSWSGSLLTQFQPTPSSRRVTIIYLDRSAVPDLFQPTPSSRRVTPLQNKQIGGIKISTNTLLAEGDVRFPAQVVGLRRFQPTPSSRRVTFFHRFLHIFVWKFQPTPSSRRVTASQANEDARSDISTNTLLAEGDLLQALRLQD